jgi:signal transduction histidine kinase
MTLPGARLSQPALILAAWLSFFALLGLLTTTLSADRSFTFGPVELAGAVLWTALTFAILTYHRYLRPRIQSLLWLAAAHLPLLILASLSDAWSTGWAMRTFAHNDPKLGLLGLAVYYLDFDLVAYAAVVAIAEIALVRRALGERQRQAERLERSIARARLDYLEAQLQPHFLFNSLGAVSELAYDAPATATRVLHQLASIFRTALGKKTDEITLGEELAGIEPYLDIQRIRFADWLTIEYRIDDDAVDCLVPRFVLQPLIENAIRHGLSGRHAAGTIEISAAVVGSRLVIRVADNGVGLSRPASARGHGIGLTNVRDRLRILYGGDENLTLTSNDDGGAVSELRIPARRYSAATAPADSPEPQAVESLRALHVPTLLRHRGLTLVVIWIVAGLIWTQQSFAYLSIRGRLGSATWASIAITDMCSAAVWALLTPIVLHFAAVVPLRRTGLAWRGGVYLLFTGIVVSVHHLVWQRVVAPGRSVFTPQNEMSLVVGFLIVCVLIAIGHRDLLRAWLRERESSADRLRAELDVARRRATKLQEIPPVLLHSLDGIADAARRDPALTERQLTRLADYLRLALECSDARGITPERERALTAAVAELEAIGACSTTLSA